MRRGARSAARRRRVLDARAHAHVRRDSASGGAASALSSRATVKCSGWPTTACSSASSLAHRAQIGAQRRRGRRSRARRAPRGPRRAPCARRADRARPARRLRQGCRAWSSTSSSRRPSPPSSSPSARATAASTRVGRIAASSLAERRSSSTCRSERTSSVRRSGPAGSLAPRLRWRISPMRRRAASRASRSGSCCDVFGVHEPPSDGAKRRSSA